MVQLSRTAVTHLYNSSGVELINHASVAALQSLTLEQTELPVELFSICLVGTVSQFFFFILFQMDVTIVYCHIEQSTPTNR